MKSSQKKKKKDRERDRDRDRDRDKDKSHRHKTDKSHSSSKSSSLSSSDSKSNISVSSNGKITSHTLSGNEISRSSGNQSSHDKPVMAASTDKMDKCKTLNTSNVTKPTSSTNQPNQMEHNGKHSINESASRMELNNLSSDLSQDGELNLQQVIANEIQTQPQTPTQVNRLNNSEELNNVPDTTTTDIESNGNKMSPSPMPNKPITPKPDRKVFVPTNIAERKPTEVAGIVIKKDYLPPPAKSIKVEKTRDDVTRVLNYDTEPNTKRPVSTAISENDTKSINDAEKIKVEKFDATIKTEPSDKKISDEKPAKKPPTSNHISENKENSLHKVEASKKPKDNSDTNTNKKIKSEFKSRESSCEKKDSKTSSSTEHRHHSSKSSSSKSSSNRSSSSSSRDCSRCYRRSKIKRTNVGVQCCKYGEPFKQMTPTSTPLKSTQNLACNMSDSLYSDLKYGRFFHGKFLTNNTNYALHNLRWQKIFMASFLHCVFQLKFIRMEVHRLFICIKTKLIA